MTIREARNKAEKRSPDCQCQIDALTEALLVLAAKKGDKRCAVCGLTSSTNTPHFAMPASYIASCLVLNGLDAYLAELPLRCAFLCAVHEHAFSSLFADVGDTSLDVGRLERRSAILRAAQIGQLLVFGGPQAVKVAQEFHAAVVALKHAANG